MKAAWAYFLGGFFLSLLLCACEASTSGGDAGPADMTAADLAETPLAAVVSVRHADPSGIAYAQCPERYDVISGGCRCELETQAVYASEPLFAESRYLCACYDGGAVKHGATATAICQLQPNGR